MDLIWIRASDDHPSPLYPRNAIAFESVEKNRWNIRRHLFSLYNGERQRETGNATRWQSAGKGWLECLSICRSIYTRCTAEKYGDPFFCRFSIWTWKWGATQGLVNIFSPFSPFFESRSTAFSWESVIREVSRGLYFGEKGFALFFCSTYRVSHKYTRPNVCRNG